VKRLEIISINSKIMFCQKVKLQIKLVVVLQVVLEILMEEMEPKDALLQNQQTSPPLQIMTKLITSWQLKDIITIEEHIKLLILFGTPKQLKRHSNGQIS
jgi:hypothetical protein